MFLAHLPAGYLLSSALLAMPSARQLSNNDRVVLLVTGLVASVLPDFDLIYVYLCHGPNHRALPSHWPPLWLGLSCLVAMAAYLLKRSSLQWHNLLVLANVELHFVLDTIAGPIRWLAPFDHTRFSFLQVPRLPGWWVLSFVFHISALFELLIVVAAAWLCWRRCTPFIQEEGEFRA